MAKRFFLIVLDSFGVGELPDAYKWHDEGSDTLGAIRGHSNFDCPNLTKLGLFNIEGVGGGVPSPAASQSSAARFRSPKSAMGQKTPGKSYCRA